MSTFRGDQMTVCCGLSGSGKSSLAMDTIYAEGQRRYVESLSSYARQFVGQMEKAETGTYRRLIAGDCHRAGRILVTRRASTVGTVTEIYDYLRVLMTRLGRTYCPTCDVPIGTQSSDEIIEKLMAEPSGTKLVFDGSTRNSCRRKSTKPCGMNCDRKVTSGCGSMVRRMKSTSRQKSTVAGKHLVEVIVDRVSCAPRWQQSLAALPAVSKHVCRWAKACCISCILSMAWRSIAGR